MIRFHSTAILLAPVLALALALTLVLQVPAWAGQGKGADIKILHAGVLLAVPGAPPLTRQSMLIADGKVIALRDGFLSPEDFHEPTARVIDLSDYFVLPGLLDLHVHLTNPARPGGTLRTLTSSNADLALVAAAHARATLAAGFTTVLDMGTGRRAHEEAIFAVRDAILAGTIPGPRIIAAGSPISAVGSSRTGLFRAQVEAVIGPQATCSGADDCRRAVREQIKRGADVINFYNTGSLLSDPSPAQTFTDAEMRAIVETAHALGRKVIADGGNTPGNAAGVTAALRAGADTVDTVTFMDEAAWAALMDTGAFFAPHLYAISASVGDTPETLRDGTMGWLPLWILEFLYHIKQQEPSAAHAFRLGAPMVFASDPGVFPHGRNAGEFAEYVKLGLSEMEAIETATVNAARMLGLEGELGTIQPGHAADIIATAKSPLEDISELSRVVFVMRAGVVYKTK